VSRAAPGFDPAALRYLDTVAAAVTLTAPIVVPVDERGATATVWAKLELQLPSGSTKDRIAAHILRTAIAAGRLTPQSTVVEASSGSTSISLAMLCARLGVRFVAVMPEGVSAERLLIIGRYGGMWELTPAAAGVPGSIAAVEHRARRDASVFWPDQFRNPDNADAHERFTGPQLMREVGQHGGRLPDGFVAAVGTAGTLMGVGRVVRRAAPGAELARVRLRDEAVDAEQGGVPCGIPGVVDCLSGLLDPAELGLGPDIEVSRAVALATTRRLCRLGFPVGPSSGLNFAGATALARRLGPGTHVATVFCDRMERYFSTDLFADLAPAVDDAVAHAGEDSAEPIAKSPR
jgi:cysteine synthase